MRKNKLKNKGWGVFICGICLKFEFNLWECCYVFFLKYVCIPMSGVLSDTGNISPTIVANIVIESIMATPEMHTTTELFYNFGKGVRQL